MNKEELVKEIAKKAKVSQKDATEVLGAILDTIEKTVAKGKKVTLVGFGTFEARKEQLELVVTLKQAAKSKSLLRQFLLSLLVKNSKNWLTNSFLSTKRGIQIGYLFLYVFFNLKSYPSELFLVFSERFSN